MVGAVYIDLTKAFDTISHSVLLSKLPSYGINDIELEWFKDYLFQRSQLIQIRNDRSDVNDIFTGVPQGSILGPTLFVLFLNDFVDCIPYSNVIKNADATVLYFGHKYKVVIQNRLIEDPKAEVLINLKKGKTETMLFVTAKPLSNIHGFDITYRGSAINHVTEYKYLGNTIDNILPLSNNFEKSYKKPLDV